MTEDTSPENLRKYLESDDPAMVQKGLSMAKGTELDIAVKDLETLLQHENIEIVKNGFAFAVENKREKEAIEAIFDGDGHSNAYKIGEIGETAIKPILKVLEEERARIGFPTEIRIIGGGIIDELIASLVEIGNVDTMCFALEEYHPYLEWEGKEHYMEVLAETGHPKAIELILSSTWDSSKDSRYHHQEVCKDIWCIDPIEGSEKYFINLLEEAIKENHFEISDYVISILGEIGDKHSVKSLIKALSYKNEYNRQQAAEALGNIGDKRAVEPLIKVLKDKNLDFRYHASEALGKIGDRRAVKPLIDFYMELKSQKAEKGILLKGSSGHYVIDIGSILKKLGHEVE